MLNAQMMVWDKFLHHVKEVVSTYKKKGIQYECCILTIIRFFYFGLLTY